MIILIKIATKVKAHGTTRSAPSSWTARNKYLAIVSRVRHLTFPYISNSLLSVASAGNGVPKMNFVIPIILTLILWTSSFTVLVSEKLAEAGKRSASALGLVITFLLGTAFVIIHFNEWQHL